MIIRKLFHASDGCNDYDAKIRLSIHFDVPWDIYAIMNFFNCVSRPFYVSVRNPWIKGKCWACLDTLDDKSSDAVLLH